MRQVFPHYGLLAEDLGFISDGKQRKRQYQKCTLAPFCGPSLVYTRTRLMQTLRPSSVPLYTSP